MCFRKKVSIIIPFTDVETEVQGGKWLAQSHSENFKYIKLNYTLAFDCHYNADSIYTVKYPRVAYSAVTMLVNFSM